jgi:hypothetical protein
MNPTTTGWLGSAATGALSQAKAVALRTFQVMESDDLADFGGLPPRVPQP